jgi:hypothetical protein
MRYSILVSSLFCISSLIAQTDSSSGSVYDTFMEDENDEQNILLEYINSPLDINHASDSELRTFPFLTIDQINRLLKERPFYKKNEVSTILGSETYQNFKSFFYLGRPQKFFKWHYLSRIKYPLQKSVGIINKRYTGPAYDLYTQVKFSIGNSLNGGILVQKDPGERHHLDHISGFLRYSNYNDRVSIILGNFILHAGQGLVYSSPFSQQKSASASTAIRTRNFYSRSYLSANESAGFLGICTKLSISDNLLLSSFYSLIRRDGSVGIPGNITGFAITGLHRTTKENTNRDILEEKTMGGIVQFQINKDLQLGATIMNTSYNPPINLKHELNTDFEIRNNFFGFSGSSISAFSTFYNLRIAHCHFAGEFAGNHQKNVSIHLSFLYTNQAWRAGFRFWHLPPGFKSPHGRIFGDQSPFPAGERGFYFGLSGKIGIKLYLDLYWSPVKKLWRTYFDPLPTASNNLFAQLTLKLKPATNIMCRFQHNNKDFYISESRVFGTKNKNSLRFQLDHKIHTGLELRSRLSFIQSPDQKYPIQHQGISYFQEIRSKISNSVQLIFRFTSFKADDYDVRTFELEHSLAGSSSLSAFYNSGIRWYLICKVNIVPSIQVSLKYRHIKFDDIDTIGSGLDMINSNVKEEVGIQIRITG